MRCCIHFAPGQLAQLRAHADRGSSILLDEARQRGDAWELACDTVEALGLLRIAGRHCPAIATPIRQAMEAAYAVGRRLGRRKGRQDVTAYLDELDQSEGRPTRSDLRAMAWRNRFK